MKKKDPVKPPKFTAKSKLTKHGATDGADDVIAGVGSNKATKKKGK